MRKTRALGLATLLALSTALGALAPAASAAAPPLGWSEPVALSDPSLTPIIDGGAHVAVDWSGNAVAVWSAFVPDSGYNAVFYRRYTPETGWGLAGMWASPWGDINEPAVATGPSGSFVLVARAVGMGVSVMSRVYDIGSDTWSFSETVNTDGPATDVRQPQVALDAAGDTWAVWVENNGTTTDLKRNYRPAGGLWGTPEFVESNTNPVSLPKLAVSWQGAAVAVWQQSDGASINLYSSRLDLMGVWSSPAVVDELAGDTYNPALAVDAGVTFVVAWLQSNGTTNNIYARRTDAMLSWLPVQQVSGNAGGGAGLVRLAGGWNLDFFAVWNQYNGIEYQMMASRSTGATWSTPVNLSASFASGGGVKGFVGVDIEGNAMAVWEQYSGTSAPTRIMSSVWTTDGGWSAPGRVDTAPGPDSPSLQGFAYFRSSDGQALWRLTDGFRETLWAQGYAAPDTTPPSLTAVLTLAGNVTSNASVWVTGSASVDAHITANGVAATWVDFGLWAALVPLASGNNTVEVVATDDAGNAAYVRLAVVYEDPVPGLEANLAAANAALATTQGQLATTQSSLASAQASLTATQAQLAAAQAELTATHAALNTTQANLTQATARDADLQTKAESASGAAGTAMLVGLLGLLVGAAAIAMGFMMSRKPPGAMAPPMPNVPLPSEKPAEPPKAP